MRRNKTITPNTGLILPSRYKQRGSIGTFSSAYPRVSGSGGGYSYNLNGYPFLAASDPIGTPPGTYDSRAGIEVRYNGSIYMYEYTISAGETLTQLDSGTDWGVPNDLNDHKAYDFKLDVTTGTPTGGISDSTAVWLNVDTGGTVTGSGLRWVLQRTTAGNSDISWTLSMRDGGDTLVDTGIYLGSVSNGS